MDGHDRHLRLVEPDPEPDDAPWVILYGCVGLLVLWVGIVIGILWWAL